MKPEKGILFACTRQDFRAEHEAAVREAARHNQTDWDLVWRLARDHGVAPLVYTNLKRCTGAALGMPAAIEEKFNRCLWQNVARRENSAQDLALILAYCNSRSTDVMLVKGAALNTTVYDQPWYTFSWDVDLVLRSRRHESGKADRREVLAYLDKLNSREDNFREHIEYEYDVHHDATMNGILPVDFQAVWREAVPVPFRGQIVLTMPLECMLITACIGSCRKRFLHLKSLCDIRELIERRQDLDWESVVRTALDYRCPNIVYTALLVTDLTLGCTLPSGVLDLLAGNPVRMTAVNAVASMLCRYARIPMLSGRDGKEILGRRLSLPLLLTYATYSWNQTRGKVREILAGRQRL